MTSPSGTWRKRTTSGRASRERCRLPRASRVSPSFAASKASSIARSSRSGLTASDKAASLRDSAEPVPVSLVPAPRGADAAALLPWPRGVPRPGGWLRAGPARLSPGAHPGKALLDGRQVHAIQHRVGGLAFPGRRPPLQHVAGTLGQVRGRRGTARGAAAPACRGSAGRPRCHPRPPPREPAGSGSGRLRAGHRAAPRAGAGSGRGSAGACACRPSPRGS